MFSCALALMLACVQPVRTPEPPKPGLLIVAPAEWGQTLAPFIAHKRARFDASFLALEAAIAKTEGRDDAERLKRCLFDMRESGTRVEYVLLVGDADVVPVRCMCLDRKTDAAFNYAFYPSDLYYADLTKASGEFEDWNGNTTDFHAGYFGEVRGEHNKSDPINFDGIDYKPEIAVGRWPVSTPEQVRIVADKTIAYEKSLVRPSGGAGEGAPPSRPVAAMIAVGGWVENKGPMDVMAAKLGSGWRVEKRYDGAGDDGKPPTANEVLSLINADDPARLIFHAGHGKPNAWDRSLGVRQIPAMNNGANPAIFLSAGCSTAYFATLPPYEAYADIHGVSHKGTDDGEVFTSPPPPPSCYARGAFNRTGLGERLLRDGPNGAVAYFGCNTGSQPCGLTLLEGFADAIGKAPADKPPRLGDCWMHAVSYYHEQQRLAELKPNDGWYPPSIFFQGMKFMLFGDPSIPMP